MAPVVEYKGLGCYFEAKGFKFLGADPLIPSVEGNVLAGLTGDPTLDPISRKSKRPNAVQQCAEATLERVE